MLLKAMLHSTACMSWRSLLVTDNQYAWVPDRTQALVLAYCLPTLFKATLFRRFRPLLG